MNELIKVNEKITVQSINKKLCDVLKESLDEENTLEIFMEKFEKVLGNYVPDQVSLSDVYVVNKDSKTHLKRIKNKIILHNKYFSSLRIAKTWIKNHFGTMLVDVKFTPFNPINYINIKINIER